MAGDVRDYRRDCCWRLHADLRSLVAAVPRYFDAFIDFPPYNEHLLHDVGAFQIGIGISVLLSLMWSDSIGVALVAFIVAGTIHSISHAVDRHLGGHSSDPWCLAGLILVALAALIVHLSGGSQQEDDPRIGVVQPDGLARAVRSSLFSGRDRGLARVILPLG